MVDTNTQQRVTEDILLLSAQQILVNLTVLPNNTTLDISQVLISTQTVDQIEHLIANFFFTLRLGSSNPQQSIVDGGGRIDAVERVTLEVGILSRCDLDDLPQDTERLTNTSLGHYQLRSAVVDALQINLMEDVNYNMPVIEPIRVLTRTMPHRHPLDNSWAVSTVTLDMPYMALVDQSRQG